MPLKRAFMLEYRELCVVFTRRLRMLANEPRKKKRQLTGPSRLVENPAPSRRCHPPPQTRQLQRCATARSASPVRWYSSTIAQPATARTDWARNVLSKPRAQQYCRSQRPDLADTHRARRLSHAPRNGRAFATGYATTWLAADGQQHRRCAQFRPQQPGEPGTRRLRYKRLRTFVNRSASRPKRRAGRPAGTSQLAHGVIYYL